MVFKKAWNVKARNSLRNVTEVKAIFSWYVIDRNNTEQWKKGIILPSYKENESIVTRKLQWHDHLSIEERATKNARTDIR